MRAPCWESANPQPTTPSTQAMPRVERPLSPRHANPAQSPAASIFRGIQAFASRIAFRTLLYRLPVGATEPVKRRMLPGVEEELGSVRPVISP
jgi:hypothetical protein